MAGRKKTAGSKSKSNGSVVDLDRELWQAAVGKSAVPGINRNDVHQEWVVNAPATVKSQFAGVVRPWLDLVHANESESHTLAALRDLLLPKLLSGEIRLKQAEKAVEAAL